MFCGVYFSGFWYIIEFGGLIFFFMVKVFVKYFFVNVVIDVMYLVKKYDVNNGVDGMI